MKKIFRLPTSNRELVKSLVYKLERKFTNCEFTVEAGHGAVECSCAAACPENDIQKFIDVFFEETGEMADRVAPKVIFEHKSKRGGIAGRKDWDGIRGTEVKGVFWLGPELHDTYSLLDEVFAKFARKFGAKQIVAPCIISQGDLEKCGYLPKEIHHVGFLCSREESEGPLHFEGACLSPAACLTTYPVLARQTLGSAREAMTFLAYVFRHEGGKFSTGRPLERVWEYQVRELVFFGGSKFCDDVKGAYFEFLKKLGESLDLSFEISPAADLFFHAEYSSKAIYQLASGSKFEFNVMLPGDAEGRLALSSFNVHGKQFVNAFDIKGPGEDFQSFCIGFGIHRWIQAILLYHSKPNDANRLLKEFSATLG